jgi:hypothetical protein
MREMIRRSGARVLRVVGASVLAAGGLGAASVLSAGAASACGVGSPCTVSGTAAVSAGSLTLVAPSSLSWSTTLDGLDQYLVDSTNDAYKVVDATGSGSGWNVTASATTFTDSNSDTLADTGTLSTNGSLTSATDTTGPGAGCLVTSTCTVPGDTTTYPVAITTDPASPTAYTIYDNSAGSGLGAILIGYRNPVGWWIDVPANTLAGIYTSRVTLQINSGP